MTIKSLSVREVKSDLLGASRFGQSVTERNRIARVSALLKEPTRQIEMLPIYFS